MPSVESGPRQPLEHRERRRNTVSHKAILDATGQLLAEVGYGQLTIEGVAARAGVGKATVYRWWPSKGSLVIEAMSISRSVPLPRDTGNLRDDLLGAVRRVIHLLTDSPEGTLIAALAADLVRDPALAKQFRQQILYPRRSIATDIVRRAVERGELPPDLDVELLLDVYAGAVFYRQVVSGVPVTDNLAEQLVGLLLDGAKPVRPSPA
ncbi:MAG: TetR/AcrR family transcriptional regulator [Jatrophihabitantaceae bacterium]